MSRLLYRLGRFCARRRWWVIVAWIAVGGAVVVANGVAGSEPSDEFEVGGVESQEASELLGQRFPAESGIRVQVVFAAEGASVTDPRFADPIARSVERLREVDGVIGARGPFGPGGGGAVSPDERVALGEMRFSEEASGPGDIDLDAMREAVRPAEEAGLRVEFGGETLAQGDEEPGGASEAIGVGVAVIVLLLAFGSVVAMGLPIVMALFGIGVGISLILLGADVLQVNTITPIIATMIGLAVGIDYSLFVVSRYRQNLARGMTVGESVGRASATAGQAVIVAGGTVMISIAGLALVGIPFVTGLGIATAVVVGVAVVLATTLLPALLGLLGPRIDRLKVPGLRLRTETDAAEGGTWSGRWARTVNRRPWPWFLAGLALLGLLALPATAMRLGFADAGSAPPGSTQREAYDLLSEGFGPGFNGPLLVVADLTRGDRAAVDALPAALRELDGVARVNPPAIGPDARTALVTVIPTTAPESEETEDLVGRIRGTVAPQVERTTGADVFVTGGTAFFIDLTDRLSSRLLPFMAAVLGLSIVLLTIVFRSVVVPLKAAFLNLLSIAAAYGIVVAVFQWGWLKALVGVEETIPIAPFVPMMMFAILFGLSMDYEVFILSRVREEWLLHRDPSGSVVDGLAKSARVVTAAATIMVAVFASFIQQDDSTVKLFGVGLAVAIALDATVVRMVLVPSFMQLLGARNWWVPRWLDRILPRVDIEGESGLPPVPGDAVRPVAADGWVGIREAAERTGVAPGLVAAWAKRGRVPVRRFRSRRTGRRYQKVAVAAVEDRARRRREAEVALRDRVESLERRADELESEAASLREEARAARRRLPRSR